MFDEEVEVSKLTCKLDILELKQDQMTQRQSDIVLLHQNAS